MRLDTVNLAQVLGVQLLGFLNTAWGSKEAAACDLFGDPAFAPPSRGTPVAPAFVRQMVRRYGERIGLPEHKRHPHALRHTCGTELYRQTKDLRLVQTVLGHSSPQVTQIYARLSGADVEDALRQFER